MQNSITFYHIMNYLTCNLLRDFLGLEQIPRMQTHTHKTERNGEISTKTKEVTPSFFPDLNNFDKSVFIRHLRLYGKSFIWFVLLSVT